MTSSPRIDEKST